MSDPDRTSRLPDARGRGTSDRTAALGDQEVDRTAALGQPATGRTAALPRTPGDPLVYEEEYGPDEPGVERTTVAPAVRRGGPRGPDGPLEEIDDARSRHTTGMLVLWCAAALLVGFILALLVLPEDEPELGAVGADDPAVQALLAAAQVELDTRDARIAELEGQLAARDGELAQARADLEAAEARLAEDGSVAPPPAADPAAEQALADREAALATREQAVEAREQQVAERETAVEAREQQVAAAEQSEPDGDAAAAEGGGFTLPDLPEVELPSQEEAQGLVERFVERIARLLGLD